MKFVLIATLLTVSSIKSEIDTTWKFAKNKDDIEVYVSKIPGSDYYAFKATMAVKSTANKIIGIFQDVERYHEWFAYTASTRLISKAKDAQVVFVETDYPWPYSNECMQYLMNFEKVQNTYYRITIEGTNEKLSCKHSLKTASGYILLEPEADKIKVTYYLHSEPSQNIPPWLINPMIHEMPFRTFLALREKLVAANP